MPSFTDRRWVPAVLAAVILCSAPAASAVTHCVPSAFSGSCDDSHATIQAAITHSVAGDTVLVAPGTYAENLTLGVDITLQGAQAGVDARGRVVGAPNPATESIIAPAAGVALTLIAGSAGATIDGFSFLGGTRAIESAGGPITNLLLQNNHIAGFTNAGVFLNDTGTDITVTRNVIDGTSKAGGGGLFHLDTDSFPGFHLEDNIIRNGATGTGFFVDGNNNVIASAGRAPHISGNLIIDNNTGMNLGSRAFDGGVAGAFIEGNTFESNNFDGLQGGPQNTTIQNNFFRGNGRSGLALTSFGNLGVDRGAQNLTITCNDFSGNLTEGIFFSASQAPGTISTNQVHNNNIAGNTAGVTYNGVVDPINADNNWWGSATGPTVASNPGGTGDSISGTGAALVDYTPFLTFTAVCVPGQAPPDVIVDKIVNDSTPNEGQAVTFTVTLTNNGGPGTLVSVTDLLPAGLTYVSDVPSQGTYASGTGVWDVGTINSPGGTATLQITATVNAGTAATMITNTATMTTSTPADSSPGDNTDSVTLTVGQPNLAIDKAVDDATPQEGQTVTFTITATNTGTGDAAAVSITDLLPAGLAFVSSTPSQGSYNSGTGVWSAGTITAPGTVTLQIVATVNAGTAATTITNTASLTASSPADPTPGDNSDSVVLTVGQPNLAIDKAVDDLTPQEGQTVTFTITATNSGTGDAAAVSITDLLPAGLTFVSSTPSQGSYNSGTGVWSAGTITAPGTVTLQIVATVNAGTAGTTITNTASLTASSPADPTPGDNSDSVVLTVLQPGLAIDKVVNDPTPQEGGTVTFTVTVANSGAGDANGVAITDLLPAGLTFVSSTPSQGSYNSGTGVWSAGTITAPGTATLQIVATVNAGTAGTTITNTATITASTPADPTPADNTDSAAVVVELPGLSIAKTANPLQPVSGSQVTFTITVSNTGAADATSVTVSDVLPAGLLFVSSTPSQGTYDAGTGVWTVGAILAGGTATLQIVATVNVPPDGSVTNTATIIASTPADPTPGDNTGSVTITAAAASAAIPSLSTLGLILLSGLLAVTALVALRKG